MRTVKAVVTWRRVIRSEVVLSDGEMRDMVARGIDPKDRPAVARYIGAVVKDEGARSLRNWFEKGAPEVLDIEPDEWEEEA